MSKTTKIKCSIFKESKTLSISMNDEISLDLKDCAIATIKEDGLTSISNIKEITTFDVLSTYTDKNGIFTNMSNSIEFRDSYSGDFIIFYLHLKKIIENGRDNTFELISPIKDKRKLPTNNLMSTNDIENSGQKHTIKGKNIGGNFLYDIYFYYYDLPFSTSDEADGIIKFEDLSFDDLLVLEKNFKKFFELLIYDFNITNEIKIKQAMHNKKIERVDENSPRLLKVIVNKEKEFDIFKPNESVWIEFIDRFGHKKIFQHARIIEIGTRSIVVDEENKGALKLPINKILKVTRAYDDFDFDKFLEEDETDEDYRKFLAKSFIDDYLYYSKEILNDFKKKDLKFLNKKYSKTIELIYCHNDFDDRTFESDIIAEIKKLV